MSNETKEEDLIRRCDVVKILESVKSDDMILENNKTFMEALHEIKNIPKVEALELHIPLGSIVWYRNGPYIMKYTVDGYSIDTNGTISMTMKDSNPTLEKTYKLIVDTTYIGSKIFLSKKEAKEYHEKVSRA